MLDKFICAALIAAQLSAGSLAPLPSETAPALPEHQYIIHASGEYDSTFNTNSREALRNAYNHGNRLIEIDFAFTRDLVPVCIHDWNEVSFPGSVNKLAVTFEEYKNGKIYGKYSPMSLDDVANFMRLHDDLYIVTDVKDYNLHFCSLLVENHSDILDRFILQVYSEDQYEQVYNMGFSNIIFTLYNLDWETKTNADYLVSFADSHPLYAYTFPYELCEIDGYVEKMKQAGIPLFVHTVNDKALQQKFFDMGIDGIYTDNTIHE